MRRIRCSVRRARGAARLEQAQAAALRSRGRGPERRSRVLAEGNRSEAEGGSRSTMHAGTCGEHRSCRPSASLRVALESLPSGLPGNVQGRTDRTPGEAEISSCLNGLSNPPAFPQDASLRCPEGLQNGFRRDNFRCRAVGSLPDLLNLQGSRALRPRFPAHFPPRERQPLLSFSRVSGKAVCGSPKLGAARRPESLLRWPAEQGQHSGESASNHPPSRSSSS